ncbi:hypothetical protein GPLA_0638 [Paraglaciecola polaris LMG 21857]|uniref:Uncharacterized protein n=1 Tax=Paraglaciecola polaris LMG 21857 TaxID=1129793 RepID=K6YFP0_9ALTE|nr:hypothetical protein GPLA_0638 [Paraglaciecola polaris LMG 21857]
MLIYARMPRRNSQLSASFVSTLLTGNTSKCWVSFLLIYGY